MIEALQLRPSSNCWRSSFPSSLFFTARWLKCLKRHSVFNCFTSWAIRLHVFWHKLNEILASPWNTVIRALRTYGSLIQSTRSTASLVSDFLHTTHSSCLVQIVDVIGGSLRTMGNARPEVARSFIEMAVSLVQVSPYEKLQLPFFEKRIWPLPLTGPIIHVRATIPYCRQACFLPPFSQLNFAKGSMVCLKFCRLSELSLNWFTQMNKNTLLVWIATLSARSYIPGCQSLLTACIAEHTTGKEVAAVLQGALDIDLYAQWQLSAFLDMFTRAPDAHSALHWDISITSLLWADKESQWWLQTSDMSGETQGGGKLVNAQAGQVMRVLKFAERWASSADPSLVRHLIYTLLGACGPPYSSDFAASVIRHAPATGHSSCVGLHVPYPAAASGSICGC